MHFKVTKEILAESSKLIKQGGARTLCCPIALAIKAGFGDSPSIMVTRTYVAMGHKAYKFPEEVRNYIAAADKAGSNFEEIPEFEFDFDIEKAEEV